MVDKRLLSFLCVDHNTNDRGGVIDALLDKSVLNVMYRYFPEIFDIIVKHRNRKSYATLTSTNSTGYLLIECFSNHLSISFIFTEL